jgi:hypothetical protein
MAARSFGAVVPGRLSTDSGNLPSEPWTWLSYSTSRMPLAGWPVAATMART